MAIVGIEPISKSLPKIPCNRLVFASTTVSVTAPEIDGENYLDLEDTWVYPYSSGEIVWGIILAVGIFGINLWVLWVVLHARELWKPRHLWMACLCVTDLFVGVHKVIELLLLILPRTMKQLCIVNKATLGIPYILNILLLTLLSLDRYIAVSYPFFYSSVASNRHVGVGFLLVLLIGVVLSWSSIAIGLQDVVCRVHFLQLKYLIVTLTICSILNLFFNISVLRIAKKQLTAIYTNGTSQLKPRPLSVVCTNCGHETVAVSAITTLTVPVVCTDSNDKVMAAANEVTPFLETTITCTDSIFDNIENKAYCSSPVEDVTGNTLCRASSLPEMSPTVTSPIEAADVSFKAEPIATQFLDGDATSLGEVTGAESVPKLNRRFRSLFSFHTMSMRGHRGSTASTPTIQFFRHLHFSRTHVFHVGRLFPSIRFARTVLFIMIPMWIFILPVITIIPLHRSCELEPTRIGCSIVDRLWTYLLVHIRSVLLLQAILDTVIYACRSKEFKNALRKAFRNKNIVKKLNRI